MTAVRALALSVVLGAAAAPGSVRTHAARRPHAPQPAADTVVVDFHLSDQFGQMHDAAAYRGRTLVLVGAASGGRAAGTAWVRTLRGLQDDAAPTTVVPVVAVADLRGVPRLLRRLVRHQFPDDRRQPVLLDWDGTVARRLAFDRERCTLVVVGPTGRPQWQTTSTAVDSALAYTILRDAATPGASTAGAAR